MTHSQPPSNTHTHTPPPYLGGCEEDLSNERRGLLHRGQTYTHTDIQTDGHRDSMTESAKWADSVKIYRSFKFILMESKLGLQCTKVQWVKWVLMGEENQLKTIILMNLGLNCFCIFFTSIQEGWWFKGCRISRNLCILSWFIK